jgi:hypothetical protein
MEADKIEEAVTSRSAHPTRERKLTMTTLDIFIIGFLIVLLLGALSAAAEERNTRIQREFQIGVLREFFSGPRAAPPPDTSDGANLVTTLVVVGAISSLLWLAANVPF